MTNDTAGLQLTERTIPVPPTISAQAQAFLAIGAFPRQASPAPDDLAGWKAHIEAANAMLTQSSEASAGRHPAHITEHRLSASVLYEVEPSTYAEATADRAIFYLHGGGFTVGFGRCAAYMAQMIAGQTGLRTFAADYRMPPDAPFPAALDDAVEAYRFVLDRYAPEKIAVHGASAGGGLAASCILRARDEGLPLPAACVLVTPEVDLTESGDSFETNRTLDIVLQERLTDSILLYANGHDRAHPYLSPLFGDFAKGFPPTLLTTGTRDLFLSNTVLMHRALRRAGLEAELHVWEAMPHGGFFGAPEDEECEAEQARFIKQRLGIG